MPQRLTPMDASFYFLEDSTTPMHVGSLAIFRKPASGLEYEDLLTLVDRRLAFVPRYRQKVREVPFSLARPVWVDDADFDLTYHVRRSALPRPGRDEQLHDLIARLSSRGLDRSRPLWEMYMVEGLSKGRVAIFTKSHQALVDGAKNLEIGQVILDAGPVPPPAKEEIWMPQSEPHDSELVVGALADAIARPGEGLETLRNAAGDVATAVGNVAKTAASVASVLRTAARTAPTSPLNAPISRNRRFTVANTSLKDYRKIRAKYGCTINDVVLTVISGALRYWLISRGEAVTSSSTIRALVPMSIYSDYDESGEPVGGGVSLVSSFLLDLPVGEANPVVRLSQVAHATGTHAKSNRSVRAGALVQLSGFAPPTLHALGARVASSLSQRVFNLLITNVPGPQVPVFADGAKMLEIYPVPPLVKNQALTMGLTSYDGRVYYGFNADREVMSDVDVMPVLIGESLEELLEATG